jgi:hypothetical protein
MASLHETECLSVCVGRAGGLEGGPLGSPSRGEGGWSPPRGGSGAAAPKKKNSGPTYFRDHMILGGFSAHGFCRWFSISG